MGKRFGRNQRRHLRDSLASCEHALEMSIKRAATQVQAERKRFEEFASQCDVIDQHGARITIDVEAIENLDQTMVDFRTRMASRNRVDLYVAERVDPRDLTRHRDNLETIIGTKVAHMMTDFLTKKGWKA